jgi:hypothetical protein
VKTGSESDGSLLGVNLDISESLVVVGGDDDVDGLNGTGERLVQVLLGNLELEKSTVDLVDNDNGLDTLSESLTQDSLGLDTDSRNTVDDDEGSVSDTKGSSDLRGEVNVTGGVDQVNQESVSVGGLLDVLAVFGVHLGEKGDSGGLDGDTTVLLILTGVGETSLTSDLGGDNSGTLDERVGKGGLSVID